MTEVVPAQLMALVKRSIKTATWMVGILMVCAGAAASESLLAQRWVTHAYTVLQATADFRESVQAMRVRAGNYLMTGAAESRQGWTGEVGKARERLGMMRQLVASNGQQSAAVELIAQRLDWRVRTAEAAMEGRRGAPAEAIVATIGSAAYQEPNKALLAAVDQVDRVERGRLSTFQYAQQWGLAALALCILGFVALGISSLHRSRRAARFVLQELLNSHRATARTRAELETFSDASPLGVFHADIHGNVTYLNRTARELIAMKSDDDPVAAWQAMLHPADREGTISAWQQMVARQASVDGVYRLQKSDGETVWVQAEIRPVCVDGNVSGFVGVARDITEAHRLRQALDQSQIRLQRVTDSVPALMAYVNRHLVYEFVNATYRTWFGEDHAPKPGDTLPAFVGQAVFASIKPHIERVLSGQPARFEMSQGSVQGKTMVADVAYTPDLDNTGSVRGFFVLVTDLTEHKKLEERVFEANERAQVTLESIGDAVVATDAQSRITFLNARAEAMLETTFKDAAGQPVDAVVRMVDSTGAPSQSSLARAISQRRTVDVLQPRQLVLSDGALLDIEDVAAPIRDRGGQVVGGVLVLRDVSVAQAIADRMRHLAEYDVLTDLPNRLLLEGRAREAIGRARQQGTGVALLFLDLDGFKAVNDTLGHGAGDDLLRAVGRYLARWVRKSDTVCRLGGDEFVILMPGVSGAGAPLALAENILAHQQEVFGHVAHARPLGFSVGVALYPEHGENIAVLLREADHALYDAKMAGKNRVVLAPAP